MKPPSDELDTCCASNGHNGVHDRNCDLVCGNQPDGFWCVRKPGHEGPHKTPALVPENAFSIDEDLNQWRTRTEKAEARVVELLAKDADKDRRLGGPGESKNPMTPEPSNLRFSSPVTSTSST